MPTDEELLRAFANGQRSALGELAERYERGLLDLALAILRSREPAVDAVQETWLRVVRYAGSFNGRSNVKTWLYRIAINQCRSSLAARLPTIQEVPDSRDLSPSPADQAARRDDADNLKRAVEALSAPLRETVLLCYTHGLTHAEAADAMEIPLGTVKSRLHAALEELRRRLDSGYRAREGKSNHGPE